MSDAQATTAAASSSNAGDGADMRLLCKEAAMGPVRDLDVSQIASMSARDVRPIMVNDFKNALLIIRPSVSKAALAECEAWCKEFGSSGS